MNETIKFLSFGFMQKDQNEWNQQGMIFIFIYAELSVLHELIKKKHFKSGKLERDYVAR